MDIGDRSTEVLDVGLVGAVAANVVVKGLDDDEQRRGDVGERRLGLRGELGSTRAVDAVIRDMTFVLGACSDQPQIDAVDRGRRTGGPRVFQRVLCPGRSGSDDAPVRPECPMATTPRGVGASVAVAVSSSSDDEQPRRDRKVTATTASRRRDPGIERGTVLSMSLPFGWAVGLPELDGQAVDTAEREAVDPPRLVVVGSHLREPAQQAG